jgi:hypothetical protein
MLDGLLDQQALQGRTSVNRDVGPEMYAHLVDDTNVEDALAAIQDLGHYWGGGSWLLLPHGEGRPVEPRWRPCLDDNLVDRVVARPGHGLPDEDGDVFGTRMTAYHGGELLWPILVASDVAAPAERPHVVYGLPAADDPWYVAYAGVFGDLPSDLSPALLQRAGLREDLQFEDLIDLKLDSEVPGPEDLIRRLRAPGASPRTLTLLELRVREAGWSQDLATAPTWTTRHWTRQFAGSNVVVVYEPGSVADLCLLWNLRSQHAHPRALPLGLPMSADAVAALRAWADPDDPSFAGTLRGFGRPFVITSMSVPQEDLEELAESTGALWTAIAAEALMQAPQRPARPSVLVTTFEDGKAQVEPFDDATRRLFQARPRHAFGLRVKVRFTVSDRPVPPLAALRNDRSFDRGWRGGGFDHEASPRADPIMVEHPTGWAVLRAAVLPYGLDVRPSAPGASAAALLRRMGSLQALDGLRDPWVLERLDGLCARKGMSWFRREVRRIARDAAGADAEAVQRIEHHLAALPLTGRDDELETLTLESLTQRLPRAVARSWLEWAERTGVLVRGIEVRCDQCTTRTWRTPAELAPPIGCSGCGRSISRPYPADGLTFRYRASRALLEVAQSDALPHLLCAGWWRALFRNGLYGFHPGVEFIDSKGSPIAEVDVVLLLADGRLALGECKRRAAGLTEREIDKQEELADRLDAAWTFYATPQWSRDCPALWTSLRRDLPERRRFSLYGEHLLRTSYEVFHPLGVDVTQPAAQEGDPEGIMERFRERLPDVLAFGERPQRLEDHVLATYLHDREGPT